MQGATDLGFILDASASLYAEGFKNETKFINDVIDAVGPITPGGLRAGVVVYSDIANIRILMNDHFTTEGFKNAVRSLPYDDEGSTRIDLGFEKAKELFTVANGARASSKKVRLIEIIYILINSVFDHPTLSQHIIYVLYSYTYVIIVWSDRTHSVTDTPFENR